MLTISPVLPRGMRHLMRGRASKPRTTPLGKWLNETRSLQKLSMRALEDRSGLTQGAISLIESRGKTKRETIERLSRGLIPDNLHGVEAEEAYFDILRRGLVAGGFIPDGDSEQFIDDLRQAGYLDNLPVATLQEIKDYIRFKSEQAKQSA